MNRRCRAAELLADQFVHLSRDVCVAARASEPDRVSQHLGRGVEGVFRAAMALDFHRRSGLGIQQCDIGRDGEREFQQGGGCFHRAIAEQDRATVFVMVVRGAFTVCGKDLLTVGFRGGIHLSITEQRVCRVGLLQAHVIGVADAFAFERVAGRESAVLAAGTDEDGIIRRVTWYEFIQCVFRGCGIRRAGELAAVIVGVNLQAHINLLEAGAAFGLLTHLILFRAEAEHHRVKDEHDGATDEQFDDRERGTAASLRGGDVFGARRWHGVVLANDADAGNGDNQARG